MKLDNLQAKLSIGRNNGILYTPHFERVFSLEGKRIESLLKTPSIEKNETERKNETIPRLSDYNQTDFLKALIDYHNFLIEKRLKRKPTVHGDFARVSKMLNTTPDWHLEDDVTSPNYTEQVIWITNGITCFQPFELTLSLEIEKLRNSQRFSVTKKYDANVIFGFNQELGKNSSARISYDLFVK